MSKDLKRTKISDGEFMVAVAEAGGEMVQVKYNDDGNWRTARIEDEALGRRVHAKIPGIQQTTLDQRRFWLWILGASTPESKKKVRERKKQERKDMAKGMKEKEGEE